MVSLVAEASTCEGGIDPNSRKSGNINSSASDQFYPSLLQQVLREEVRSHVEAAGN